MRLKVERRTRTLRLALFLAALCALSTALFGHIHRPTPTVAKTSAALDAIAGTWKGQLEITTTGGQKERATGVLWLKARGTRLFGAMGASEDSLKAITHASGIPAGCQFTLLLHDTEVRFDLTLTKGQLHGEGIGPGITITVALQPAPTAHPLYEQVATLDARLFDAFNARDLPTIEAMFAKDVEFYHDKDGVSRYDQNMSSFKSHFASPTKVRRELDDETLEVYPVKEFGAIEIGVHRFYSTEPGQPETLTATAKFVHVWKKCKGVWQIVRVVSYDHE